MVEEIKVACFSFFNLSVYDTSSLTTCNVRSCTVEGRIVELWVGGFSRRKRCEAKKSSFRGRRFKGRLKPPNQC